MNDVLVLLSTYNGEKYIREQLDSLLNQESVNISILVRDDNSSDATQDILNEYQNNNLLKWYSGPNIKPANSFLDLLRNAPEFDYYAFCDQDDVWMHNKLISAIEFLKRNNAEMYYSSYTTVDSDLNIISKDVQHHHKDTLGASLVNQEVTGCTIVFTNKLMKEVRRYKPHCIMMHDSWLYKIALALNYKVVYDPVSYIYYRQHCNNVIGANKGFLKKWKQRYKRWFKIVSNSRYYETEELYNGYKDIIPKEQLQVLEPLINYTHKNLLERCRLAFHPVYRTGMFKTDLYFAVAVILKRF